MISVKIKKEADYALQSLDIAATKCKVVKYKQIKSTTQCNKCQRFEHSTISCRAQIQNCRICAQKHATHEHKCSDCRSNKVCSYVQIKCSNCSKNHQANDKRCLEYQALLNTKKAASISTQQNQHI